MIWWHQVQQAWYPSAVTHRDNFQICGMTRNSMREKTVALLWINVLSSLFLNFLHFPSTKSEENAKVSTAHRMKKEKDGKNPLLLFTIPLHNFLPLSPFTVTLRNSAKNSKKSCHIASNDCFTNLMCVNLGPRTRKNVHLTFRVYLYIYVNLSRSLHVVFIPWKSLVAGMWSPRCTRDKWSTKSARYKSMPEELRSSSKIYFFKAAKARWILLDWKIDVHWLRCETSSAAAITAFLINSTSSGRSVWDGGN